jgi:hypothetical protein
MIFKANKDHLSTLAPYLNHGAQSGAALGSAGRD